MLGNFTDIIVLLDRSSSMRNIAGATRKAYNSFLKEQQDAPGEARFTLAVFSTSDDFVYLYKDTPIASVAGLDAHSYDPVGGGTALRLAFGTLIEDRGRQYTAVPEQSRPNRVIVCVQTDGQENASGSAFPAHKLKAMIDVQSSVYNWQFTFLGANQDAILVAKDFGIKHGDALTFYADEQGIANSVSAMSHKVNLYRSTGQNVAYSNADRTASMSGNDPAPKPSK